MSRILIVVSLLLVFSTVSAESQSKSLNWVGCGISKKSYMTALAKAYGESTGVQINLEGGGATRGIRDVGGNKADFGGSCRFHLPKLNTESRVGFEPVAWDALAVIVHSENKVNNINIPQVQDLLEGKLTNWKQLGGDDAPIHLFVRKGKISGVGYTVRKLIFADQKKEFAAYRQFPSTGPLEKAVEEDKNAIAITGISSARLRQVKVLSLNNIQPNFEAIKSGKYLLYRPLFITYNPHGENIGDVKDFIRFAHSKAARQILVKNGVVPYLDAIRLVLKQVEQDKIAQRSSKDVVTYR